MISFSSAERETIKPTLALDFTIRLNPPVKSIILRGKPIIFRSCSKRQRVAADHLKRCSSIIRQYGYSDRHLTSNTLAANPFLISLLVLFSRRDFFDITALYPAELLPQTCEGGKARTSDLRHPKQSFNCCYRLF